MSGNYDFTPDTRMIVVTILFLALIIGLQPVKFKIGRPGFFKRCLPGVVLGACDVCGNLAAGEFPERAQALQ